MAIPECRDLLQQESIDFWTPIFADANMQAFWLTDDRIGAPVANPGKRTMTLCDTDCKTRRVRPSPEATPLFFNGH